MHDIEISCGSKENNERSTRLAELLESRFSGCEQLLKLTISGEYENIFYQASKTPTITDDRWEAFHVELPPSLRMEGRRTGGKPPQSGYRFCDCLVEALNEMRLYVD
jgi:hypothetical protein